MAKVTGGLFSLSASGKFAKSLVFATSRGTQYVRQLVIPTNPRTLGQMTNRSKMRIAAESQRWTGAQTVNRPAMIVLDKTALIAASVGSLAWNSTLVKAMLGTGHISYNTDESAYQALTAPQKTAWDAGAAALTPPMMPVAQSTTGGVATTTAPAGKVYYHHVAALWRLGINAAPGVAPPA